MTHEEFAEGVRSAFLAGRFVPAVFARRKDGKSLVINVNAKTPQHHHHGCEFAGQLIAERIPGSDLLGHACLMTDGKNDLLVIAFVWIGGARRHATIYKIINGARDLVPHEIRHSSPPELNHVMKGYLLGLMGVKIPLQGHFEEVTS